MTEIDLYGPPGTGKTTRLKGMAALGAQRFGPHRVGAVTFTRAAAAELKERIAEELGIKLPQTPAHRKKILDANIPHVGTIHALCYKLLGYPPLLSGKQLAEFARGVDPRSRLSERQLPANPEDLEGYEWGVADASGRDQVEFALNVYAASRHRMLSIADTFDHLPMPWRMDYLPTPDQVAETITRYERYKRDLGVLDFEDLLIEGRKLTLPVSLLLCDEVQDNSALLWSVIDAWAKPASTVVMAGDPWQAIYLFSGASPTLFRQRQGVWQTIGDSHRLTQQTAEQALEILRSAGWEDDALLQTWQGVGSGEERENGSTFYLARTNRLLAGLRAQLEREGKPYRNLRGYSPLETRAAKAYREYVKLAEGETDFFGGVVNLIKELPANAFPYGWQSQARARAERAPETAIPEHDRAMLLAAAPGLDRFDYYADIRRTYGMAGLIRTPAIAVGTIHSAKGKEADHVYVVRNWGTLPGRAVFNGARREEACVAYVAATRHRASFNLIDSDEAGVLYPW